MPALLVLALRLLASTAIFAAGDAIFERMIDQDEETALDEILAGSTAVAFMTASQKLQIRNSIKAIPMMKNVQTAEQLGDYLEAIAKNRKGAAVLNAKLGGFGPLAIKLAKGAAAVLTKKGILLSVGAVIVYKFVSWLIWAPQLGQQFLDQGVFAPEQANAILDSWGIPEKFRWPISEVRETQTQLDEIKLASKIDQLSAGFASFGSTPKTIIKIVEDKKPEQFIGTLFSAKLGALKDFNRHVDDEITSEEDLLADVKTNLNRWLASLPGRLGYSIIVRKDPVDHVGVKQSGMWVTLTLHMTRLSGPIQPIDTILIGPVSPATRLKLNKVIKTIEVQIPELLTGQEIMQVEIPNGSVDMFSVDGERVDLSTPRTKSTAPAPLPKATPSSLAIKQIDTTPLAGSELKTIDELARLALTHKAEPIEAFVSLGGVFIAKGEWSGTLFREKDGMLWTYNPVNDLMSNAERASAGNFGAQKGRTQTLLRERGVNITALPQVQFIADVIQKYRGKQIGKQTFDEFFV